MTRYAILFFKISCAEDKPCPSDDLFRIAKAQPGIQGSDSGNTSDLNTHCGFNDTNMFMLPGVTNFRVPNQGNVFGAAEPGIIQIPERYPAKD